MKVFETSRLSLHHLTIEDAVFIRSLMNDPSWLRYIGDMGVETISDAERYLSNGPIKMYHEHGFGLFRVQIKATGKPIGICGLIRREALDDVDLGFAFLPSHWRKGYAYESAMGTMEYARIHLGLTRLVAITSEDNEPSGKLLGKLGFRFEKRIQLKPAEEQLKLYSVSFEDAREADASVHVGRWFGLA